MHFSASLLTVLAVSISTVHGEYLSSSSLEDIQRRAVARVHARDILIQNRDVTSSVFPRSEDGSDTHMSSVGGDSVGAESSGHGSGSFAGSSTMSGKEIWPSRVEKVDQGRKAIIKGVNGCSGIFLFGTAKPIDEVEKFTVASHMYADKIEEYLGLVHAMAVKEKMTVKHIRLEVPDEQTGVKMEADFKELMPASEHMDWKTHVYDYEGENKKAKKGELPVWTFTGEHGQGENDKPTVHEEVEMQSPPASKSGSDKEMSDAESDKSGSKKSSSNGSKGSAPMEISSEDEP